jgi:hypothetical protein
VVLCDLNHAPASAPEVFYHLLESGRIAMLMLQRPK